MSTNVVAISDKKAKRVGGTRRRATRAEHEQRIAEVSELIVQCAPSQLIVRFACEKWGIGERAAEKYLAQARERLRERADIDPPAELAMALASYDFIYRRQLKKDDLRGACATVAKRSALLGLAGPRLEDLSIDAIKRELVRRVHELEAQDSHTA